jgi:pimeloyl-ACP methyl ester carboxylesterase
MTETTVKIIHIPCPPRAKTSPTWPTTSCSLYPPAVDDNAILIWVPGGEGQQTEVIAMKNLLGKRRILIPRSHYPIRSYFNKKYVPQAFEKDQTARLWSLIKWAQAHRYQIILGGHSNGTPRLLGLLMHYPDVQSQIKGIILSASHVGREDPQLPIEHVEWNIPILVLHHQRDLCPSCRPDHQHWLYQNLKNLNKQNTKQVMLTSGWRGASTDCSSTALHHMYLESSDEAADAVDGFITQVTV